MLNLKNKLRVPSVVTPPSSVAEDITSPFQITAYLPENPPSVGHDFNLVRIVADHGPPRIAAIEKEIQTLESRITSLTKEKNQIARLVAALDASE